MTPKEEDVFPRLVKELKDKVLLMESSDGRKPTFDEYIYVMMEEGKISFNNLEYQLRGQSLLWSGARLGKVDWKITYNKILNNINEINEFREKNIKAKDDIFEDEPNREESSTETTSSMKFKVRSSNFIQSLFKELDAEFIKLFQNIGSLIISGVVLIIFTIWRLAILFGEEYQFHNVLLGIGIISFIGYFTFFLDDKSKLKQVLSILGITAAMLLIIMFIAYLVISIIQFFYQLIF